MPYKKNIIVYFLMSIILIGIAIGVQVFVPASISVFLVAILVGAATGIIATMVSCILDNNHKLQIEILAFEKTTCRILGRIYNIARLDVNNDNIVIEVEKNLDETCDYLQELLLIIEKINLLMIFPVKESKMQKVVDDLEKIHLFLMWDYNFPGKIEKYEKGNPEEIKIFEALKAIKFMRKFNPQPILNYLKKSKNNVMKSFSDKECFFNIIFERDVFNEERAKEGEKYARHEIEELVELYKKYDITRVRSLVDKVQMNDWIFSTQSAKNRNIKKSQTR